MGGFGWAVTGLGSVTMRLNGFGREMRCGEGGGEGKVFEGFHGPWTGKERAKIHLAYRTVSRLDHRRQSPGKAR